MSNPVAPIPPELVDALTAQTAPTVIQPPVDYRPGDGYGAAALATEAARVRATPNGERNHALNRSSFRMGRLVGAGVLDRTAAEQELAAAAQAAGLEPVETEKTIKSGLDKGVLQPRVITPRQRNTMTEPPEPPPFDDQCADVPPDVEAPQPQPTRRLLSADTILETSWPAPVIVIPDILTAGLGILGGAAKLGKSWLGLQMVAAVAAGGQVLGRKVDAGPVLYLALEDPPRRLQERMVKQRWPRSLPADFITIGNFAPMVGDLLHGGAVRLGAMIEERQYRLVVVDTFSRAIAGDQMDVAEMTRALTPLQEMAHRHNCAVLLIDHHRKTNAVKGGGPGPDVIADILGSTAKGAMADNILGLYRERGKNGAKLAVTGREIGEQTLALIMDWGLGCWQCEGEAGALEVTERRREILDALGTLGRAKLKDLADATEQNKGNVYKRLADLIAAGQVKKAGQYYVPA